MNIELLIKQLENDIAFAEAKLKNDSEAMYAEGYPYICGCLESCIRHMKRVIEQYKEDNNGKYENL